MKLERKGCDRVRREYGRERKRCGRGRKRLGKIRRGCGRGRRGRGRDGRGCAIRRQIFVNSRADLQTLMYLIIYNLSQP